MPVLRQRERTDLRRVLVVRGGAVLATTQVAQRAGERRPTRPSERGSQAFHVAGEVRTLPVDTFLAWRLATNRWDDPCDVGRGIPLRHLEELGQERSSTPELCPIGHDPVEL